MAEIVIKHGVVVAKGGLVDERINVAGQMLHQRNLLVAARNRLAKLWHEGDPAGSQIKPTTRRDTEIFDCYDNLKMYRQGLECDAELGVI